MKRLVRNQTGMTLMEMIIAIAMLSVISLAAFSGLQYAFYTLGAAEDYAEDAFENQQAFETVLTNSMPSDTTFDKDNIVPPTGYNAGTDETITFTWGSGTTLANFECVGVTFEESVEGGEYLERPIYVFVPVTTNDVTP